MKKIIAVLLSAITALLIVFGLPMLFGKEKTVSAMRTNEESLVEQEIISYSDEPISYEKIYVDGKLIGIISDPAYLSDSIEKKYREYENDFPDTQLGLNDNVYVAPETSFVRFENADEKIFDYLVDNSLLGVKTVGVEFSTASGVYDIIYVKSKKDFEEAYRNFILNFVSEEGLTRLSSSTYNSNPGEIQVGETREVSIDVLEDTSYIEAIVSPDDIFKNTKDIYDYLCYGRNSEKEYYTVREGDTLNGVGYYFGDMSPKQLMMLNSDVLLSEDQVVFPGMQLNVTYYTSPLTVEVKKENLSQQIVAPMAPLYVEDEELEAGKTEVLVKEENGLKNVLYSETWINGVLENGELISEQSIIDPIQGVIAVGTKQVIMVGTGNYIWPVDNPSITCHWGCYLNHTGTDFVNKYNRYGPAYAVDSGVVQDKGWKYDMGNYVTINHNNGIMTTYMHLNTPAYVSVGENVLRGETIGQIGNTGVSEGAHLHLLFMVNGIRVNACNYMPCYLID